MKQHGCPTRLTVGQRDKYIAFQWSHVERAVEVWASELSHLADFDTILPIARGGLVPAVLLSHLVKKRSFSFFQGTRTNSDAPHDYCPLSLTVPPHVNRFEKFLIVEDIIFKGDTTQGAIDYIQDHAGLVVAVCTLVVDEQFQKNDSAKHSDEIPMIAVYKCPKDKWIRFPWEHRISEEVIPTV
jgi:uncharacterized protein